MNRPYRVVDTRALGQRQGGEAPLPMVDGALYRHPNPDGSRKRCGNCIMWVSSEETCVIHKRDQHVDEAAWCGYHIFGQPMAEWMDHPGIQPVTPDISGLRMVGPGAACGSCRYYRDSGGGKGLCVAVSSKEDRRPPVPVATDGVCARFEVM